jgi:hypothetical protein
LLEKLNKTTILQYNNNKISWYHTQKDDQL